MSNLSLILFSSLETLAIAIALSLAVSLIVATVTVKVTRWALDRPAPERGRGRAFWVLAVVGTLLPFAIIPLALFWTLAIGLGGMLQHTRGARRDDAAMPEEDDGVVPEDSVATQEPEEQWAPVEMVVETEADEEVTAPQQVESPKRRRSATGSSLLEGLGAVTALLVLLLAYVVLSEADGLLPMLTPLLLTLSPVALVSLVREFTGRRAMTSPHG